MFLIAVPEPENSEENYARRNINNHVSIFLEPGRQIHKPFCQFIFLQFVPLFRFHIVPFQFKFIRLWRKGLPCRNPLSLSPESKGAG
jgi:hypothetical protein